MAFLQRRVEPSTADLIVAADVLLYMRDLTDLFVEVAAALRPGGLFAFSTELAEDSECGGIPPQGRGWVERQSERIAHSESYVRWLVDTTDGLDLQPVRDQHSKRGPQTAAGSPVHRLEGIGGVPSRDCGVGTLTIY